MKPNALLHWPRSLFARLALILFVSLALVQTLSVWLTMTERDQNMTNVMMGYIEQEVTSSVALLDHLPADERAAWLPRLARRTYTFVLGPGVAGAPPDAALSERVAQSIADGIGKRYPLTVNAVPGDPDRLQVHLQLSDGTPLTIDYHPMPGAPLSPWLSWLLILQLV
ncbi:MAG: hypothetical protein QOF46_2937, partial [Paraburkholderia sp.]|nr:hypothetical protein [Paraburkholderia sp.]